MNNNRPIVIVGGGVAGLAAAETLAQNDLPCVVVEQEAALGGHVKNWACTATDKCLGCYCCKVDDLIHSATSSDKISVELGWYLSEVVRDGSRLQKVGLRSVRDDVEKFVDACAVIVAVGFRSYDPRDKVFWGYKRLDGVVTLVELNEWAHTGSLSSFASDESQPLRVAFLQCIGSRDASIGANYCSEYCCAAALRMALSLVHEHPGWEVSVFYIDLQIAGKMAGSLMDEAQRRGIHLVQGVPGEIVQTPNGSLSVACTKNGRNIREEFDRIVLSTGMMPARATRALAEILGLQLDYVGFVVPSESLSPNRTETPGVYVAGTCSGPANIQKSLLSGVGAAAAVIADYSSL